MVSCEYNFANLFSWQKSHDLSWTIFQDRLLIHAGVPFKTFMPLGDFLPPTDLASLSLSLKRDGRSPDFSLVTDDYLLQYPELNQYYTLKKERRYAEYIYDRDTLVKLPGKKLHKKRNLISQFHRQYPGFTISVLNDRYRQSALDLAHELMMQTSVPSKTLQDEMAAMKIAFQHFDSLGLEGLALLLDDRLIAFSVFSRLGKSGYDIHFEKSDLQFKGAAQVINQETAQWLAEKCTYLNREQDLGIRGLRQAKMSYDPLRIVTPVTLIFSLPD